MNIHSVTICLNCGKVVPSTIHYCQLCGKDFPAKLPMPLPNYDRPLAKAA